MENALTQSQKASSRHININTCTGHVMPSQCNLIKSIIRGWRNIFPGVRGAGGRLGEGEADQGDSHLSEYLFVCKK